MRRTLSLLSLVSGIYDGLVGVSLLVAADQLGAWFGVPAPVPPIHKDLNGLFLLAVAIGYAFPYRDPVRYRGYLWVMGPFLKGAGAVAFVLDHLVRGSPASFLVFAASDATLAVVTGWALVRSYAGSVDHPHGHEPAVRGVPRRTRSSQ